MKFYSFLVGCLFTLIVNCIFSSKCDVVKGSLHELNLNGVKFSGSLAHSNQLESVLPLDSAKFTIEFSQNGKPSNYVYCDGIFYIHVPKSVDGETEMQQYFRRFLIFDCNGLSCQFKIEALFIDTRMEGVKNLNIWHQSKMDLSTKCEWETESEVKNVYWNIRLTLDIRKSLPPLDESELQKFREPKTLAQKDAVSVYAITPFEEPPSGDPILFAMVPFLLDETSSLVTVRPMHVKFLPDGVYDIVHELQTGIVEEEEGEEQEVEEESQFCDVDPHQGEVQVEDEVQDQDQNRGLVQVEDQVEDQVQVMDGKKNQVSTVSNTNTFTRNQGILIPEMPEKNERNRVDKSRKSKKLHTLRLNIDYAPQENCAFNTECSCETNLSSMENTNSSTIRTTPTETSASVKLWISFLYLSLCLFYQF